MRRHMVTLRNRGGLVFSVGEDEPIIDAVEAKLALEVLGHGV